MSRRSLVFVILGESGVGKTSLTDKVAHDTQYHHYDPFHSSEGYTRMVLQLGSDLLDISIMDISLTPIRATEDGFVAEIFDNALREADGVVLLYDITREESYTHVTDFGWDYVWGCRAQDDESGLEYPLGPARFGCTLVGNKVDLVQSDDSEKREVPKYLAEEWASMVGVKAFEVDRFDKSRLEDVLRDLVKSTNRAKRRDEEDLELVRERRKVRYQASEGSEKAKPKSKRFPSLSRLKDILQGTGSKPITKG